MYGIWVFSMLFVGLQTGLWGAKRVLGRYWEVEEKQNMPRVARLFYPFPILPFYWIDYLTASSLGTGDSITCSLLATNGSSAYYANVYQVDSSTSNVTVKWSGGTAPSAGNASAIDIYSFTIVKTAATPAYTILAAGPIKYA